MERVKLINVGSKIDADMLTDLLNQEGIWAESKAIGSGSYMQITTGLNIYGFDIYVEDVDLEKAEEIAELFKNKPKEKEDNKQKNLIINKPAILLIVAIIIVFLMLIVYILVK